MRNLILAALAVSAASAAPAAPTYIHAGRLIAVPGQPVRGPATLVVENGRIVRVENGFVAAPDGASTIDLRAMTVLPGLIDSHVHLDSDRAGNEAGIAAMSESKELRTFEALTNAQKTLRAGFTTVRNLGGSPAIAALKAAGERGWITAPRIVDAAVGISHHVGPHGRAPRPQRGAARAPAGAGESLRRARRLPEGDPRARSAAAPTSSRSRRPAGSTAGSRPAWASRCSTTKPKRSSTPRTSMARRSPRTPMAPTASKSRFAPASIPSSTAP